MGRSYPKPVAPRETPPVDPRVDTILWALLFASIAGFLMAACYYLGRYAR